MMSSSSMPVATHVIHVYKYSIFFAFLFFISSFFHGVIPDHHHLLLSVSIIIGILISFLSKMIPVTIRILLLSVACVLFGSTLSGSILYLSTFLGSGTCVLLQTPFALLCARPEVDIIVSECLQIVLGLFLFYFVGALRIAYAAKTRGHPELARERLGSWSFSLAALLVTFSYIYIPSIREKSLRFLTTTPTPTTTTIENTLSSTSLIYFSLAIATCVWLKSAVLLRRADDREIDTLDDIINDVVIMINPFPVWILFCAVVGVIGAFINQITQAHSPPPLQSSSSSSSVSKKELIQEKLD